MFIPSFMKIRTKHKRRRSGTIFRNSAEGFSLWRKKWHWYISEGEGEYAPLSTGAAIALGVCGTAVWGRRWSEFYSFVVSSWGCCVF